MENYVTTNQAAKIINRSRPRVHQLIQEGRLKAKKFGRDYYINLDDLMNLELRKPTGRPRNDKIQDNPAPASKKSA